MEVTFNVFSANKALAMRDVFLHACDVFEPWKRLVSFNEVKVTFDGDANDVAAAIVKAVEAEGGYVVFLGAKNCGVTSRLMPGVRAVSDGKAWATLSDVLKKIGYTPSVDESMTVLSVE